MSAIDLTSLVAVKNWLGAGSSPGAWAAGTTYALGAQIIDPANHLQKATTGGTSGGTIPTFNDIGGTTPDGSGPLVWTDQGLSQDSLIAAAITAFSVEFLRQTGRGPADGTVPALSPFVQVVSYDEFYDGSGSARQFVRNAPIVSVSAVNIDGVTVPQSTGVLIPGWVIDGSAKSISLRGGSVVNRSLMGNYGGAYARYPRSTWCFNMGAQNVEVVYTAGFSSTPSDIEFLARRAVGLNYHRAQHIDQKSQSMAAGAGTIAFQEWDMPPEYHAVISSYRRRALV